MRFKTGITIRKLVLIILTFLYLHACVDSIPLYQEDGQRKLFVICEMTSGEDIIADVTFTGSSVGVAPDILMKPDTFNFAIAEGYKDFGVPFIYDQTSKKFLIKKQALPLQTNEIYKFRGIGANKNSSEPNVTIPRAINIDTLILENVVRSTEQGKKITRLDCTIKITPPEVLPAYFHIIPKSENNGIWIVKSVLRDQSASKRLNHKDGLLIDYSRLTNNEIHLSLEITETSETNFVDLELFNTSSSYYQFNYYISNINSGNYDQNTEIPAIAGFNIKSDKAFGTFSAKTLSKKSVKIK